MSLFVASVDGLLVLSPLSFLSLILFIVISPSESWMYF